MNAGEERSWTPFVAQRGMYEGWDYADSAVRHVEQHNCSKGCTVPEPAAVEEFGPGGSCPLLALLYTGDPIPDMEGTEAHVVCHARQVPDAALHELKP